MKIDGAKGTNTQAGLMGRNQPTDSYSRNIQNQIANAQKQLQELSSNEEMTLEEKMKKRQEIQRQISDLNMQLRQHQVEQRKERQQAKSSSLGHLPNGTNTKAGKKGTGLSQASMTAMISADTSMKQAQVQGAMAAKMEGKAGVLKSEIKMDKARGGNTEAKEAELADLQVRVQAATASQISALADAGKTMEEAAKADQNGDKVSGTKEEKAARPENAAKKTAEGSINEEKNRILGDGLQAENVQYAGTADSETHMAQTVVYTHVDVRL